MNKKALKSVGLFWLFVFGLLSYVGIISWLTITYNNVAFFVIGLSIPMVTAFSFIIYEASVEEENEK